MPIKRIIYPEKSVTGRSAFASMPRGVCRGLAGCAGGRGRSLPGLGSLIKVFNKNQTYTNQDTNLGTA